MDQTLKLKLEELEKALQSLEEVAKMERAEIIRDSTIKRFEYTFELLWKTAKVLSDQIYGMQVFSPKESFRTLKRNALIDDETTEALMKIVDDRNEAVHTYSQTFADELYEQIQKQYVFIIRKVFDILKERAE